MPERGTKYRKTEPECASGPVRVSALSCEVPHASSPVLAALPQAEWLVFCRQLLSGRNALSICFASK